MNIDEKIEKLYALIEELKASYIEKLNNTAEEYLADINSSHEGAEKIREIAKNAVEEFSADLEKALADLENKINAAGADADASVDAAVVEAEAEITSGFAKVFERIYAKLKDLFRG